MLTTYKMPGSFNMSNLLLVIIEDIVYRNGIRNSLISSNPVVHLQPFLPAPYVQPQLLFLLEPHKSPNVAADVCHNLCICREYLIPLGLPDLQQSLRPEAFVVLLAERGDFFFEAFGFPQHSFNLLPSLLRSLLGRNSPEELFLGNVITSAI